MKRITNKKYSGSILVFTLIILFLTVITAIGVANVTVIERKSSFLTDRTISAFQVADSGAEEILEQVYGNKHVTVGDLVSSAGMTCNGGIITGNIGIDRNFKIQPFRFSDNDFTNSSLDYYVPISVCDDYNDVITKIKSIGTYGDNLRAVEIETTPKIVAVAAGLTHSLALDADGTVWAWGNNDYGQLGQDDVVSRDLPTEVRYEDMDGGPGVNYNILADIVAIAAGRYHSLALDDNGNVWAWGDSASGQAGNCAENFETLPVQVRQDDCTGSAVYLGDQSNLIKDISAGRYHSLALEEDGDVWSWGSASHLGRGGEYKSADQVPGINDIIQISGGGEYSIVLDKDGNMWGWGDNNTSQLGLGGPSFESSPVEISYEEGGAVELITMVYVSSGDSFALAVDRTGNIWGWGDNANYQLGTTSSSRLDWPNSITALQGAPSLLVNIRSVEASGVSSYAVNNNGDVLAWGNSDYGSLGDNSVNCGATGSDTELPVYVATDASGTLLDNARQISGRGSQVTLVIDSNNSLWAWGRNQNDELGRGNPACSSYAIRPKLSW